MNRAMTTPLSLEHVWLPYTQMQHCPAPLHVVGAEGVQLQLADGRTLIDGVSSWWTACHGYGHPHIRNTVAKQLDILPHVMFAGLGHDAAYTLAARLASITPAGLNRVFFSDSGSTSVEVAMKMAVQYWRNQGEPARNRFISFQHGYHGDTMGAMSLADPEDWVHKAFNHYGPAQICSPIPRSEKDWADFKALLEQHAYESAAVIIEPLVQGAGGFRLHSPETLATLRSLTNEAGLLFIADEVATGFGRTGSMFACDEACITPDIMCLGKALTGGTMTLAATLATDEIFDAFLSDNISDAFMHGPTYMANPLACAAANASLDLFEQEPRLEQVAAISAQLSKELEPCRNLTNVVDVRVKGAIGVVELESCDWQTLQTLRAAFVEHGCWIRPFDRVVYLAPPFVITPDELSQLTRAIQHVLSSS